MVKVRTESFVIFGWFLLFYGDRFVIIDGYLVEKKRFGVYIWSRCYEVEWVVIFELTVVSVVEEGDF